MRNSPRFPYGYDPKRILVGDVDGDGLADLVYVDDRQVHAVDQPERQRAGAMPIVIRGTPPVSDMDACAWSTCSAPASRRPVERRSRRRAGAQHVLPRLHRRHEALPAERDGQPHGGGHPGALRALDAILPGGPRKPETRWKTPLPFPVQVVARVEVIDEISGGKLTTEYRYHHGYWDGAEREFRGFGRVDQRDTEIFDDYNSAGLHPERPFAFVPRKAFRRRPRPGPGSIWAQSVRSMGRGRNSTSAEYWSEDPPMLVLGRPDELEDVLQTLPRRARRDAVRAFAAASCGPNSTPSTAPNGRTAPIR